MKFTFDRDAMIKEVAIAQEIISNKSPIAILSNILLIAENNSLTIKAVDLAVKFTTSIPVEVKEEGTTTIYCDKFMSILSALPSGEIEFSQEDIKVTIRPIAKKLKFQLNSQTSDKFPETGSSDNVPFFMVPSKEFKDMIRQTIFAVATEKTRFFMTGVYFLKNDDKLTMCATNGGRLSVVDKAIANNVPDFPPAIIQTKILSLILKHAPEEGNVFIAVVDKMIFVKFGNYEFSSNLIDGQFPNYKKVIPENLTSSFSVYKADLDAAIKRTSIMIDKNVNRIIFKLTAGVLRLVSPESTLGNADEEIPCRYDGPDVSMGLNISYVSDPLKVVDSEYIVFDFTPEADDGSGDVRVEKTIVIHSDPKSDYLHIIVPMKY